MNFFQKNLELTLIFLVSLAPTLTLLLRGSVTGADSWAFWGVSCGTNYGGALSSPPLFVYFIQHVINCNLFILAGTMFFLYFLALLGIYFFGKRFITHQAWRFPLYVASLTPLFFIEAMRFENDFFGWTLAFICLGLLSVAISKEKDIYKYGISFLGAIVGLIALILWEPSIFILSLSVFLISAPLFWYYLTLIFVLGITLMDKTGYASHSVSQGLGINAVAEEIPFVGIIFILHIIHFWRKIPFPMFFYGVFLILLGLLKSKYMFLAVPLLILGLINKHDQNNGLFIKGDKVPINFFVAFLTIGFIIMGLFMAPTPTEIQEIQYSIQYAKDNNLLLLNDWGEGWKFIAFGYDTNFKASPSNPVFEDYNKPYLAYTKIDLNCLKIKNKTYLCN